MNRRTGWRTLVVTLAVIIALGATLLAVASRFWFERPEPVPSQPAVLRETVSSEETAALRETFPPAEGTVPPDPSLEPTPDPAPEPSLSELRITSGEVLDTYEDESVKIQLRRFEIGEGQARVTYFTAEAIVLDMNRLASGFAKDTFGRNIQERPSVMARRAGALLAVNGDYYGFRDDGVLIRNGLLYRDAPARTGAAFLSDGRMVIYDETGVSAEVLLAMGALHTVSFGPALLRDGEVQSDFPGGIRSLNPRTAVGMIAPGHFVFLVADGRSKGYSQGLTLSQLAELFQELGCTEAYNLDGGGTSTMVWRGEVTNYPQGRGAERASSDILYIK
jgi:hypothetical protein